MTVALSLAIVACARDVAGQSSPPSAPSGTTGGAASADPRFTYATIGGASDFTSGLSIQALNVLLQLKALPWLTVFTSPAFVHAAVASTPGKSLSSSGLTDLPVGVTATHRLPDAPLSPEVSAGLEVTLPLGDTARGLGSGQTSLAGDFGLGVSPTDNLSLDLNVWRPFTGAGVNSMLDGPRATSLGVESSYDWTDRFATTLGYTADLGHADSGATLPASIAAGLVFKFAKPLAITVDGARGLTTGAPRWLVALGVGTAFNGIDPLGENSLWAQFRHALGRGVDRGHGQGKVGCGHGTC
jgi:hypothetical protein